MSEDDLNASQVEAELFNELDDLERNYASSNSSYSQDNSTIQEGLLTADNYSNENSFLGNLIVQSPNSNSKTNQDVTLLCSIPGYELFKESSEVSSASCLATLQTVDSVKKLFDGCGAEKSIDDIETQNEGESDVVAENDKMNLNNRAENINHHSQCEVKFDSSDVPKNETKQQPVKNDMDSMIFLNTLLVEDREKDQEKLFVIEMMQKDIEFEAEEEQLSQKQKRDENSRKRVMDASKERERCVAQSKSARCIQRASRENHRRKKSSKIRAIYKGFLQLSYLEEYWSIKGSFITWLEYSIKMGMALKIQLRFHVFIQKSRRRRRLLKAAIRNLIYGIILRRTFLFWAVYTSTMKLQERVMLELTNSAIIIQCIYRAYRAKCLLRDLKEVYHSIIIQKHFRAFEAHRVFRQRKEANERKRIIGAVFIQKVYRGYKTRIQVQKLIDTSYSYEDRDIDKILSEEAEQADFILDEIIWTMETDQSSTTDWRPRKPPIKNDHHNSMSSSDCYGRSKYSKGNVKEEVEKEKNSEKDTNDEQNSIDIMDEWKFSDQRIVEVSLQFRRVTC